MEQGRPTWRQLSEESSDDKAEDTERTISSSEPEDEGVRQVYKEGEIMAVAQYDQGDESESDPKQPRVTPDAEEAGCRDTGRAARQAR